MIKFTVSEITYLVSRRGLTTSDPDVCTLRRITYQGSEPVRFNARRELTFPSKPAALDHARSLARHDVAAATRLGLLSDVAEDERAGTVTVTISQQRAQ